MADSFGSFGPCILFKRNLIDGLESIYRVGEFAAGRGRRNGWFSLFDRLDILKEDMSSVFDLPRQILVLLKAGNVITGADFIVKDSTPVLASDLALLMGKLFRNKIEKTRKERTVEPRLMAEPEEEIPVGTCSGKKGSNGVIAGALLLVAVGCGFGKISVAPTPNPAEIAVGKTNQERRIKELAAQIAEDKLKETEEKISSELDQVQKKVRAFVTTSSDGSCSLTVTWKSHRYTSPKLPFTVKKCPQPQPTFHACIPTPRERSWIAYNLYTADPPEPTVFKPAVTMFTTLFWTIRSEYDRQKDTFIIEIASVDESQGKRGFLLSNRYMTSGDKFQRTAHRSPFTSDTWSPSPSGTWLIYPEVVATPIYSRLRPVGVFCVSTPALESTPAIAIETVMHEDEMGIAVNFVWWYAGGELARCSWASSPEGITWVTKVAVKTGQTSLKKTLTSAMWELPRKYLYSF